MYQKEFCNAMMGIGQSWSSLNADLLEELSQKMELDWEGFLTKFLDSNGTNVIRGFIVKEPNNQIIASRIQQRCKLLVPLGDSEIVELVNSIAWLIAGKEICKNGIVSLELTDNEQITGQEFVESLIGILPFRDDKKPLLSYQKTEGRIERFISVAKLVFASLLEEDQDNTDSIWRSIIIELSKATSAISLQKKFDNIDLEILGFYYRVMAFFEYVDNRFDDCYKRVALSEILQLLCPELESMKLSDGISIRVAKCMLNQDTCLKVIKAFRCLAVIAYGKGELQLAYDALYTLLSRKSVGIIKEEELFCLADKPGILSDVPSSLIKSIQRLFSDVCISIGDAYGIGEGCEVFIELAKKQLSDDEIKYDDDEMCIVYNQLIVQQAKMMILRGEYEKAKCLLDEVILNVQKCMQLPSGDMIVSFHIAEFYLSSLRMKAIALFLMLSQQKGKDVEYDTLAADEEVMALRTSVSAFVKKIKPVHWTNKSRDEIRWAFLLENTGRGNQEAYDIYWLIDSLSEFLIRALRRHEYEMPRFFTREKELDGILEDNNKPAEDTIIAYYTTLNNFMFLFDELRVDNDGTPKISNEGESGTNCFTVMHENYMNDPYEGVALIGAMKAEKVFSEKPLALYREKLLQKQHVFLKSFTDETDKLHMWNRYASDYDSDGKSSNGCCVVIDTETFRRIVLSNRKQGNNDDYNLYRVLYVTKNGELIFEKEGDTEKRIRYMFECLKMLFIALDERISKNNKTRIMQQIIDTSFGRLMFLVKDGAYEDEHESRIIIRKGLSDNSIRTLDKTQPAKLALNPLFQVYVKMVILGPNVKYKDEWKPILRKKLSMMWKKIETAGNNIDVSTMFSIEDSEIPYTSK